MPESSSSGFIGERNFHGDKAREVEEEMAMGDGKQLTDVDGQKVIRGAEMIVIPNSGNVNMILSSDTGFGADNSEPVCVQMEDKLTMGVLQLKDSGIYGDVTKKVGASDVKGDVNDSSINKGKHKVFKGGRSSEDMFSTEDTMALGKIFKDNLMSKKNSGPMGGKGVRSAKRHFKRHSPKKPGIVMSPKHAKFFHVQSPHKPHKVGILKKLDLNAKVSGDSLGTKRKILADLEKDCDVRKRMRGDMEVSLNKELAEFAL
ncbi:hypothetical protein TorRG33x02_320460 [Trema orientale]|uniref:Uncharacterized protein n=1 Tax=Trema orientale TaxID=63057 RepID=A0A2P5BI40_TREOI|nr:hypothetical protein TorRG33x02_320460 [Trema orientale]